MIQVIDGQIVAHSLPKVETLSSGEAVSGYHMLPKETLYKEGWHHEVEKPPSHNEEAEQLFIKDYTFTQEEKARDSFEDSELEISSSELANKIASVTNKIKKQQQLMTDLEEQLENLKDVDEEISTKEDSVWHSEEELIKEELAWHKEEVLRKEKELTKLEEMKIITIYIATANYKVTTISEPELSEADVLKARLDATEEALMQILLEGVDE